MPNVSKSAREYIDFINKVGHGKFDNLDVTYEGYPLSAKEAKFIDIFLVEGDVSKALKECNMTMRSIAGKDYIVNEIRHRLEELKKATIADADEVMQYFTKVMRNEEKDQFGLDAPLSERTAAARELAKRTIDSARLTDAPPEIKVTLNWDD